MRDSEDYEKFAIKRKFERDTQTFICSTLGVSFTGDYR